MIDLVLQQLREITIGFDRLSQASVILVVNPNPGGSRNTHHQIGKLKQSSQPHPALARPWISGLISGPQNPTGCIPDKHYALSTPICGAAIPSRTRSTRKQSQWRSVAQSLASVQTARPPPRQTFAETDCWVVESSAGHDRDFIVPPLMKFAWSGRRLYSTAALSQQ
jgi:hypothetical protein